ncbi:hypothetical protein NPIL_237701 [Nephila pilipes]|uniref:Uncharacterized protein n=1 Tax=Nephila pilipes TaxID=299642 RepID=A0A8X6NGL6_NEPPI|nr:hypothetical protein NPIL_237701 [Nephila pilipes]
MSSFRSPHFTTQESPNSLPFPLPEGKSKITSFRTDNKDRSKNENHYSRKTHSIKITNYACDFLPSVVSLQRLLLRNFLLVSVNKRLRAVTKPLFGAKEWWEAEHLPRQR